ncbi:MAG: aminodeoxychorismate/anthranilate synthase component II [Candidatus Riflemargulisbacteria bacterium]
MILIVDNYDSFTYNIAQYFLRLGCEVLVKRNDEITIADIRQLDPSHIVLSPGPGRPEDAGICLEVLKEFKGEKPILGICLGHQAIGQFFGAKIVNAKNICHGKIDKMINDGKGVFCGVPSEIKATRYHSLVIDESTISSELEITARTPDNEIMGVRHKVLNIEGVQFHPESIGSEYGMELLGNFISQSSENKTDFIPTEAEGS